MIELKDNKKRIEAKDILNLKESYEFKGYLKKLKEGKCHKKMSNGKRCGRRVGRNHTVPDAILKYRYDKGKKEGLKYQVMGEDVDVMEGNGNVRFDRVGTYGYLCGEHDGRAYRRIENSKNNAPNEKENKTNIDIYMGMYLDSEDFQRDHEFGNNILGVLDGWVEDIEKEGRVNINFEYTEIARNLRFYNVLIVYKYLTLVNKVLNEVEKIGGDERIGCLLRLINNEIEGLVYSDNEIGKDIINLEDSLHKDNGEELKEYPFKRGEGGTMYWTSLDALWKWFIQCFNNLDTNFNYRRVNDERKEYYYCNVVYSGGSLRMCINLPVSYDYDADIELNIISKRHLKKEDDELINKLEEFGDFELPIIEMTGL